MSKEDSPQKNESWLQYFRRKRKFSDLMLLAWSQIEFNIDQIFTRQFGLRVDEEKAQILLEMGIGKKLEFLKKTHVISNNEFDIIQNFQRYRNKLFHGEQPFFFILDEPEKERIMDIAVEAAHLTLEIGLRGTMPRNK